MLKGKRVSFEGEQGALPLRKLPSVPILSQVWRCIAFESLIFHSFPSLFFVFLQFSSFLILQIDSCRSQTNQTLPKLYLKVILNLQRFHYTPLYIFSIWQWWCERSAKNQAFIHYILSEEFQLLTSPILQVPITISLSRGHLDTFSVLSQLLSDSKASHRSSKAPVKLPSFQFHDGTPSNPLPGGKFFFW